ncbi:MAG: HypC/HybG/HupF family hydrogenase formation chaperone [Candidatus Zixiibacteriota bacterium]
MCLAVPGKVIWIEKKDNLMPSGKADFGGIIKTVNLAFVPDVEVDDYILVHTGFAISIIDERVAQQTLEELDKIIEQEL